jgi:ParB family chromosome partitioning protein
MKPNRLGRGLRSLITRTEGPAPAAGSPQVPPAAPAKEATPPAPAGPGSVPQSLAGRVQAPPPAPRATPAAAPAAEEAGVRGLPVASIRPNPYQPRVAFDDAALQELADSIRTHGVLQPIVVRRALGGYEVLAGERRLRAAKSIGLESIPALLREATDEEMQTLALVENVQREDLNAMEKARALRAMMSNFGLTQDQVAARVGKARTTIANVIRLLELSPEIQRWVEEGRLSGAHARALLLVKGPERRLTLAKLAVELGLSVREIERRAASEAGGAAGGSNAKRDPFVADLVKRLERALSTNVRLHPKGKGGRIEIRYHDAADLDRLLEIMKA